MAVRRGLGDAFDRLSAGGLDWMFDAPRPQDLASLQAAHPDQVVLSPIAVTAPLVGFDLGKRPFDDVRVRQALNDAIDRDHVVELLGGPTTRRPTCQMLPPNFQGYEPICPYTLEPASGVWSAPDRDQAQALIEDADAAGEKVTVWITAACAERPGPASETEDRARQRQVLLRRSTREVSRRSTSPDGAANYPGAGGFIDDDLRCGAPGTAVALCTKSIDAQVQEAQQLQATDPAAANRAWTEIDHELVQEAVWAPLTNPLSAYAFSARVENIQVHPEWEILLSRLWVQ